MSATAGETATCERCGGSFRVPKEKYGHLARCPHCHRVVPAIRMESGLPISGPGVLAQGFEVSDGRRFNVPIKGESFHLPALEALDAGRRALGLEVEFDAYLVRDHENAHDANATAVFAVGHGQVGYLSREDAVRYLPAMTALERMRRFPGCKAKLVGGTPEKPYLGVMLDLPEPEVLLAAVRELAAART